MPSRLPRMQAAPPIAAADAWVGAVWAASQGALCCAANTAQGRRAMAMPQQATGAETVAEALRAAGVPRLYGVPGGGSSLDLIEAAAARGIPFVLARQETAARLMAATEAELSHRPGAVLVTRGPGVGNAANGIAQASLDRAPLLLLADGFTGAERAYANHQFFDHAGMLAPVTKAAAKAVEPGGAPGAMAATLLEAALAAPCGPVLLELSAGTARAP